MVLSGTNTQITRRLDQLFDDLSSAGPNSGSIMVSGLCADSRTVKPGTLFAALPGTAVDGVRFVKDAQTAGAVAVLADRDSAVESDLPVILSSDPRRVLAIAAARFYGQQPANVVAVTGTNGKTSVTNFLRQLWEMAGFRSASLGTIGLLSPGRATSGNLTTPDPIILHQTLAELVGDEISHVALEASSHGLEQRRLDGVEFSAAAFTNLSRDHLDYHKDLESYFAAKMRLFDTLLPEGRSIVVDADNPYAERVMEIAEDHNLICLSVGERGRTIRLKSVTRMFDGARILVEANAQQQYLTLPLLGQFQISNALVAAALAAATGVEMAKALAGLERLDGVPGRLERVGVHRTGAQIFVDYSHTPDALATALKALRVHTDGRLIVVFGAGGDRDPGKRPLMGDAASRHADAVVVTDDNPRMEDPAAIRSQIIEGATDAIEIGGRKRAIRTAMAGLQAGDILLVAGKGHETGQIVGEEVLPYSDHDEIRAALAVLEGVT